MNLMGIDIDGLGNHNFDYGADYFRQTLVPLANYPFVSSNIVDANGKTPAEWTPSHVFKFDGGIKVGDRRLLERRHPVADQARRARSVPRHELDRGGQCRGGQGREEGRRHRRHRPPRRDGWDPDQPDRAAPRPRQRRDQRRRRRRRSHRPAGADDDVQRRPRHREPQQGSALHAHPDRRRRRQGGRRLQDGRLPQAVGHRRHAGSRRSRPSSTN